VVRGFQPAEGFQGEVPLPGADPTPSGEKKLKKLKSNPASKDPKYEGKESFAEFLQLKFYYARKMKETC
jgi:hypothetical protein